MDHNITQAVFDSLEADTTELSKTLAQQADLEKKIRENRYSEQTLQQEIYPKQAALRSKIRNDSAKAIEKAKNLINQYRQEAEKLNDLDPAEITDDIKLLQVGIPLLPRDIYAILERNNGNRTMTQLALRYAKDHGIDMKGTYYTGTQAEQQTADRLDSILSYYAKWIDKDNAHDMLLKFFHAE